MCFIKLYNLPLGIYRILYYKGTICTIMNFKIFLRQECFYHPKSRMSASYKVVQLCGYESHRCGDSMWRCWRVFNFAEDTHNARSIRNTWIVFHIISTGWFIYENNTIFSIFCSLYRKLFFFAILIPV